MIKIVGMVLIVASTTGVGIAASINQRKKYSIFSELINLCELLKLELKYRETPIVELLSNLLNEYNELGFIKTDFIEKKSTVKSLLNSHENAEISEFLYSLGKSDLSSQIRQIELYINIYKMHQEEYLSSYKKYQKIYLSLGLFSGLTFCLIIA